MVKRIGSALLAALVGTAAAHTTGTLGNAIFSVPAGWKEVKREPERIVFRSSDGRQQATISILAFAKVPTFEQFERICQDRLYAERRELIDGFIEPQKPFQEGKISGMFFSGGDKKSDRVFSGYLSLKGKELITIYVEGIGVKPAVHLASFKALVQGFHWK